METTETLSKVLPPPDPPGPIKWVRENLFSNLFNTILTVISVVLLYFILEGAIRWVFTTADWRPVTQSPLLYAVGQYPRDELLRVGLGLSLVLFMLGVSWGKWGGLLRSIAIVGAILFAVIALLPIQHRELTTGMRIYLGANVPAIFVGYYLGRWKSIKPLHIGIGWLITPIIVVILFSGIENVQFLDRVITTSWGGLMVTFLLAIGGIVLSFPIGVLLALGRRSSLPVVKAVSILFIETIRGVPLITILFMFSMIVSLFLPQETRLDRLLRALFAMIVFSSAYTAENVRGGLQAIPLGQIEAAKAVGMSGFQTMLLIVLPQAIRMVIPAIVGQFIALFKDTTLVVIIGINDLLGIGRAIINSSPEFVQLQTEVYIFIALIYWIFSYLMSLASRRVEAAMGVGQR
jgi:general L-amino acid transport system permease protein